MFALHRLIYLHIFTFSPRFPLTFSQTIISQAIESIPNFLCLDDRLILTRLSAHLHEHFRLLRKRMKKGAGDIRCDNVALDAQSGLSLGAL